MWLRLITARQKALIEEAIEERRTILIAGGAGSGKTTLVNAVIAHLATACADDARHSGRHCRDRVRKRKRGDAEDERDRHLRRLVRATLRLRPDRIIVGEVRGPEALDLLKAWNTGHPGGVATIHANNATAALTRLENLVAEATAAPMQVAIATAIDLVVSIARTPRGRRVEKVIRVTGFDGASYTTTRED